MTSKVENVISSKLYAEMAKNSVPVKVATAVNKQIEVFNSANNLVKDNVDYFTSEKETEVCNKKEKTKNILKTIGLAALCVGVAAGGVFRARKLSKLTDAEKYIRKHCRVHREGGYKIIKGKWGETVDLSKIGELKDNTIVRYNTPEQAKQAAKDLVMKQFELPFEMQREYGVSVEGRDIVDIAIGDSHSVKGIKRVYSPMYNRTIDFYHNHPLDASYVDYPLSESDIRGLIRHNEKSVTAYNHLGEYSRVGITDPWKADYYFWNIFDEIDCHEVSACLGEEKGMRYKFLYDNINKESPAELKKEFQNLRDEFQNEFKEWSDKNPQKYAQSAHRAYSAVLPKYGIKYTTNYSNLVNV